MQEMWCKACPRRRKWGEWEKEFHEQEYKYIVDAITWPALEELFPIIVAVSPFITS
jgi:hypothetical protein